MFVELKELFAAWIAAVAAAIEAVMALVVPPRRVLLREGDANCFEARVTSRIKGATSEDASFRLLHGRVEPPLSPEWLATLRGSHTEIMMRPDDLLFRTIEFPKQAEDFLDGMVRAQIDRLTPWTAGDVVFGMTPPVPIAGERITLVLAATSRQKIQPLTKLAADLGAASITGLVEVPEADEATAPVQVFKQPLTSAIGDAIDVPRLLRLTLLGASLAAAASLLIATYVGRSVDAESQELQQRLSQHRAAHRINRTSGSAEMLLAKRKQTSPASVMVLDAVSRVLPDSTYVTELRVEGDKMQVVGLTQDAPSLIKLMEQSPQFTRATFFAPTTRSQGDPGERFHIEAHITPYFGSGS